MATCHACGRLLGDQHGQRFCASCGAPLGAEPTATSAPTQSGAVPVPARRAALAAERFLPGTIVAGRYRIFGLIGRGGMGEVYRADDLKLGHCSARDRSLPHHHRDRRISTPPCRAPDA